MAQGRGMVAAGATGAGASASLIALALNIATPQIQTFEGQRTQAYHDVAGVLTVCSGHTGKDIVVKKVYTKDECHRLTASDAKKAADGVLKVSPQLAWHPMQLAAAISFTYNLGTGAYAKSTVATLFNKGEYIQACDFIPRYDKVNGRVNQGLVNRRAQERNLCLSTITVEGLKYVNSE